MAMRTLFALTIVALLAATASSHSTDNHGKDNGPDVEETPFESYTVTSPSVSGETWTLVVVMDQANMDNGTTFEITSQICLNNGVCDPPVVQDVAVDGLEHTTSLTPPDDHTYVNWRVKATYEDNSTEHFPYGSWYKIWSSCYNHEGTFYGDDADGDACADDDDSGMLPGFTLVPAIASIGLAVAIARRH